MLNIRLLNMSNVFAMHVQNCYGLIIIIFPLLHNDGLTLGLPQKTSQLNLHQSLRFQCSNIWNNSKLMNTFCEACNFLELNVSEAFQRDPACLCTFPQSPSRQTAQDAVELLIFLINSWGICAVVVLFSSKQRQVTRPAERKEKKRWRMIKSTNATLILLMNR